jgi:nucleoside 2-deoxyribosyltransferase
MDEPEGERLPLRVFLAAPFTQLIDSRDGLVDASSRSDLRAMYDALAARGYSVFLAHEREAWGKELMTPEECTPLDFAEMEKADVVCAHLGNPPSLGVQIELGWASSLRKPMLILTDDEARYSPLLWGLARLTETTFFPLAGRSLSAAAGDVCDALDKVVETSLGVRGAGSPPAGPAGGPGIGRVPDVMRSSS